LTYFQSLGLRVGTPQVQGDTLQQVEVGIPQQEGILAPQLGEGSPLGGLRLVEGSLLEHHQVGGTLREGESQDLQLEEGNPKEGEGGRSVANQSKG
jgi:hypothetical protein